LEVHNKCTQLLINLGIYDLFSKGILISDINDNQINFGTLYGSSTDYNHFAELCSDKDIMFSSGIVDNPFQYGTGDYVIPFHSPIYSYLSVHKAGDLYVALNAAIITKHFNTKDVLASGEVFIIIDDFMYSYDGNNIANISQLLPYIDLAQAETIDNRTARTKKIPQLGNNEFILVQSNTTGWIIMQHIPQFYVSTNNLKLSVFIVNSLLIIFISSMAFLVLNRLINKPVQSIVKQLICVASGDFSTRTILKGEDEFYVIGREIDHMTESIQQLMNNTLENEKLKTAYEFKILQSQINPHFLYNTLNSIRWLGEMNGVSGITEITTSLASMLHTIAKIQAQFVTLDTELSFIKNYVTIQYYRYGNTFNVDYIIESEKLRNAKIIKFILQPLVENAIFHGIEPSGRQGTISIRVFSVDMDLFIQVKDNGVGIAPGELVKLNSNKTDSSSKDIGLSNIRQRLILEYGDAYGLTIESELSAYTLVTIHTPLEFFETDNSTASDNNQNYKPTCEGDEYNAKSIDC